MTSRVTMTLIVATSLLMAGCSSPPTLEARCGEAVLPVADELILPNEALDADAHGAIVDLQRHYEELGAEYDFSDRYEWFIAERSPDQLVLFGVPLEPLTPDAPGYAFYKFQGTEGSWSLDNGGQCRIEVRAPGFASARWVFDPAIEPDPTSNELAVLIYEHSCASGRAPIGRDILPVVVEEDDVVTITVLVEPVKGHATCPGNVWHPIVVELDDPIGDRSLLDGSTPAVPKANLATDSSESRLSRRRAVDDIRSPPPPALRGTSPLPPSGYSPQRSLRSLGGETAHQFAWGQTARPLGEERSAAG